jgi:hypothetical protein
MVQPGTAEYGFATAEVVLIGPVEDKVNVNVKFTLEQATKVQRWREV